MVFLGAGLGGVLRFLASGFVQRLANGWLFPIGTATVNVIGCLVIGFLAQLAESRAFLSGEMRALIMVGILGGFTTFSTFGYETFQLLRDGEYLMAVANVGLQVTIGVVFVAVGYSLARLL